MGHGCGTFSILLSFSKEKYDLTVYLSLTLSDTKLRCFRAYIVSKACYPNLFCDSPLLLRLENPIPSGKESPQNSQEEYYIRL